MVSGSAFSGFQNFNKLLFFLLETKLHEKILLILTSMVAKAAISCSLAVMAGCTIELVNGNRKKTAAYSVLVFSRVILLSAPFIGASWFYLGRMSPPTLMGGLTVFNGFLNLIVVPERRG